MKIKDSIYFSNIKGKNILHSDTQSVSNSLSPDNDNIQQNLILNNDLNNKEKFI